MLRKLLKYEIKATQRIFLPLYTVLFSFALINRIISSSLEWQTPQVITMMIYIMILMGTFAATFIMMIQRFNRNLLSDEGYLMFTLPTKPWKHIMSKLLVSMMWIIASGLAAIISIIIISGRRVMITEFFSVIRNIIIEFPVVLTSSSIIFLLETLLFGLIALASGVLIIYASISIGHLFNQNRMLASVGAFIALSTVTQILFVIIGNSLYLSVQLNDFHTVSTIIHYKMWSIIAVTGVLASGYYIITNYILSKRLNLE